MTHTAKNTVSDELLDELLHRLEARLNPDDPTWFDLRGDPAVDFRDAISALRASIPGGVGVKGLEIAARNLIAARFDTYKARNGRMMSIEADDGEKCWIVHFDEMHELECALSALDLSPAEGEPVTSAALSDPTEEMIAAGLRVDLSNEDERAAVINLWHAMAAAAPSNPVISDEMVERAEAAYFDLVKRGEGPFSMHAALTAALSVKPQSGSDKP